MDENLDSISEKANKKTGIGFLFNLIISIVVLAYGIMFIRATGVISAMLASFICPFILVAIFIVSIFLHLLNKKANNNVNVFKYTGVWMLVIIILMITSYVGAFLSRNNKNAEYIEVNGIQIPSLYKLTQYEGEVFFTSKESGYDNGIRISNTTFIYEKTIPIGVRDSFEDELLDLGYVIIINDGTEIYVRNESEDTFSYVCIFNTEVEYGVGIGGTYKDLFNTSKRH